MLYVQLLPVIPVRSFFIVFWSHSCCQHWLQGEPLPFKACASHQFHSLICTHFTHTVQDPSLQVVIKPFIGCIVHAKNCTITENAGQLPRPCFKINFSLNNLCPLFWLKITAQSFPNSLAVTQFIFHPRQGWHFSLVGPIPSSVPCPRHISHPFSCLKIPKLPPPAH